MLLMSNMSITDEFLQNYYNKKELFSVNLAMTLMRHLDSNLDLLKIIVDFYNRKKYYYEDIKLYSNIIINIGNMIINQDFKSELYESLLNFNDDKLKIIVEILAELLNHFSINGITYKVHSDSIIQSKYKCRIRYIIISYHSGRLAVHNSQQKSSRSKILTFKLRSQARI